MSEQFCSFGEITSVRIIRPTKEIPADLRNHTSKHPELGVQTCVVLDFADTSAAQVLHWLGYLLYGPQLKAILTCKEVQAAVVPSCGLIHGKIGKTISAEIMTPPAAGQGPGDVITSPTLLVTPWCGVSRNPSIFRDSTWRLGFSW